MSSGSESDYAKYWIDWFLETKGNEYFCEVDEDYILDRFNLTGLSQEVQQYYSEALDMITDNLGTVNRTFERKYSACIADCFSFSCAEKTRNR